MLSSPASNGQIRNNTKDVPPAWRVCGVHPGWWGALVLVICVSITVLVSVLAQNSERDRNYDTFQDRARLRVNALAQAFYSHFPELAGLRAALEGDATSTEFLGLRRFGAESIADQIVAANPGRVSGVGYNVEIDRVHIGVVEQQLDALYASNANRV